MMVKKLTERQRRTINYYFSDPKTRGNARKSALKAGFAKSTAETTATLWFSKNKEFCPDKWLHVWEAVDERRKKAQKKAEINEDRLLKEDAHIAYADIAGIFSPQGTTLSPHDIPEEVRRAISGVDVVERFNPSTKETVTTYKYRFWDKGRAIERLGKHLGLFEKDNQQKGVSLLELYEALQQFNPQLADKIKERLIDGAGGNK